MLAARNKSILVVDDDQDIITILKIALEKNGWAVKEFTDPLAALQHFKQHPADYDVVLSDIRMPGMSGFDLVKKVKAVNPQVKAFLMTAFELSASELQKVLPSVKAEGLIEKPVSMHVLVSMIEKRISA